MAKKKRGSRAAAANAADGLPPTADYRHDTASRTNLPGAAMAGEGQVPAKGPVKYAYSPHLDPVLRFDPEARADKVKAIVEKACRGERLDASEQEILRAVGENWEQPWLEWAGKQEEHARGHFHVDPVALHIHERISAQAILRSAMRQDTDKSLFAAPEQSYAESLRFYKHDVDWANRLILGDSLQVMSSLAQRENLAGKVQMIYMDPPYGINYSSNFQNEVGKKQAGDQRERNLSREPEMIRAYRDTWHLGQNSYLAYLRERIRACRDLLTTEGSLFFQISEEHLHRCQCILDEIFGNENFVSVITVKKLSPLGTKKMARVADYILWYCKSRNEAKFRNIFLQKSVGSASRYDWIQERTGHLFKAKSDADLLRAINEAKGRAFCPQAVMSSGYTPTCTFNFEMNGRVIPANRKSWRTNRAGIDRLIGCERLTIQGRLPYLTAFQDDHPTMPINNIWDDMGAASTSYEKVYVVQTASRVLQRCMLMTTDPGDLVLDPTCGSGTSAFVAEAWGRRWITIDSSRVSISVARQRIMTSKFDHYQTEDGPRGLSGFENPGVGFRLKVVPHITLGAIAQNQNLDPIFDKHEPILVDRLASANAALSGVPESLRGALKAKLAEKEKAEGKRSITDADRRRWILPPDNRDPKVKWTVDASFEGWYDWEVPFDTDPDWPQDLQDAVVAYREAWRAKMDEVNACIAANAEQEELVDQPEKVKGVTRVSGPFTVEGVIPEEMSIDEDGQVVDPTPNEFEDDEEAADADRGRQQNTIAYIERLIDKLRADGITFPNNQRMVFSAVESLVEGGDLSGVHARATEEGEEDATVGIVFGPEHGPVTAWQVEEAIRSAKYYDLIVVAGFAFDPEATAEVQEIMESGAIKARIELAHMRPELNSTMEALLKDPSKGSNQQLFTVFGLPSISLKPADDAEFTVTLEGVDIFDPVKATVNSTKGDKVAAWFLDSDYDGRCFCTCQAFFPNQNAWEKIAKALKSEADPEVFEAFKGLTSLPFARGDHGRIAVKAIDARGNEVMTVKSLPGTGG